MVRIHWALAVFAFLLLITNIVLGLRTGDYNGAARQYQAVRQKLHELRIAGDIEPRQLQLQQKELRRIGREIELLEQSNVLHFLFGLAASLVTVLVNSITITYFIGTSRWCKEVVETYRLEPELVERGVALKRRTFRWALGGILTIVLVIILGGAALPFGANAARAAEWVVPHYIAAFAGTILIGWSFLAQTGNISANYEVIRRILARVKQIRIDRGLDTPVPMRGATADPTGGERDASLRPASQ